jgi:hypothetical protein
VQIPDRRINTTVEISNRFATLESLDKGFDINNAWKNIRENIKTSAKDNLGYHRQNIINHGLMISAQI